MSDSLSKLAQQAGELTSQVIDRLKPLWNVYAKSKLCPHGEDKWDRLEISPDGSVTFFTEYNDACHCHPEITWDEHTIAVDDLDLSADEYEDALKQQWELLRQLDSVRKGK